MGKRAGSHNDKQRFPSGNRCSPHGLTLQSTQNRVMVGMLMVCERCTSSVLPSARTALFTGFREIHREAASPQLLLMEGVNRLVATARHGYEAEAPEPPGVSVRDQIDGLHFPVGTEEVANFLLARGEREIANIDVCRHSCLLTLHACTACKHNRHSLSTMNRESGDTMPTKPGIVTITREGTGNPCLFRRESRNRSGRQSCRNVPSTSRIVNGIMG